MRTLAPNAGVRRSVLIPCCPDGDRTIVDLRMRTQCPPAADFDNVELSIENRTGSAFSLEFRNEKNRPCHKIQSQALAISAAAAFASGEMNGSAQTAERYGEEVNKPLIGTPFVSMVQDGRINDRECSVPGSPITGVYSLLEGEGVRRRMGIGSQGFLSFEMFRMVDTGTAKMVQLTIHLE
jgi:hypothetical protein